MTQTTTTSRLRPFKPIAFGRYTLLLPLSTGGMGEIFLARLEGARGFEKLCVIKRILPHLAQDRDFVTRFVNEAKTLAQLSHGSIAQIQELGMVDGTPFLAIEYVDGKDLRRVAARMRDRNLPMPLTFVLYTMSRVLEALAYAHRKRDDEEVEIGLVHRDVSPQNILISYEGEVKVIDFGLAKSTLNESHTNPSIVLGKFLYMSPEQARHQNVDRRSDLYSLGLCLYEMLAGKNPFDDFPPGELMAKVASPQIRPLNQVEPLTPPAIAQVVMKALAPDPAHRFQTAEEFRGRVLACMMEIDPAAGAESASRFMREVFGAERLAEKKLHASLREALKPPEPESDTAVHLLAPPAGRPVLEPVGPRREVSPLSFKPTPTNRAMNTDFSDRDRETMPGISIDPEALGREPEPETGQAPVVTEPPPAPPRVPSVSPGIVSGKLLEPTEPRGYGLHADEVKPPRASAPHHAGPPAHAVPLSPALPSSHATSGTHAALGKVPARPVTNSNELTDPSLAPIQGPPGLVPRRQEVTKPLAPIVLSPAPVPAPAPASPLDTLPPSGPMAIPPSVLPPAASAPRASAAAAAVSAPPAPPKGPLPELIPEARATIATPETKKGAAVVDRMPRALEKGVLAPQVDTQRTRSSRLNLVWILLPLVAMVGVGSYIGYDMWKEQQAISDGEKEKAQPKPTLPTPVSRHDTEPAPDVKSKPEAVAPDNDEIAPLDPTKPKPVVKKTAKPQSPAERALAELERSYQLMEEASPGTNKYKLKVKVLQDKMEKQGKLDPATFVKSCDDLRREIDKARSEVVHE